MTIQFATCDRTRALGFLQAVYPTVTDTPDSAGPLLDLVARDVVRVQDPMMHGKSIAAIPSAAYTDADYDPVMAAIALVQQ